MRNHKGNDDTKRWMDILVDTTVCSYQYPVCNFLLSSPRLHIDQTTLQANVHKTHVLKWTSEDMTSSDIRTTVWWPCLTTGGAIIFWHKGWGIIVVSCRAIFQHPAGKACGSCRCRYSHKEVMHFAWTKKPIFLLNVMPLLGLGFSYGEKWLAVIFSDLALQRYGVGKYPIVWDSLIEIQD